MELQSIVGDADARRQFRFTRLRQLVANVREERLLRPHFRRDLQSLGHAQMRRMRFVAKGVDDERFDFGDLIDDGLGDRAAIAEVSDEYFPATPGCETPCRCRPPRRTPASRYRSTSAAVDRADLANDKPRSRSRSSGRLATFPSRGR